MTKGFLGVPKSVIESLGIKPTYECIKCGNRENFRISIHNNWAIPVGSIGFFDDPFQHVASRDYVLRCLICDYEIIVHKKSD